MLVMYHGNCSDGFCAAWVVRKIYPQAEFVPVYHGQNPPEVAGQNVLILDFAYPRSIICEMKQKAKSLMVIDHHKTAMNDLSKIPDCIFDMNKSGASLTWGFFKGGEPPWLVAYTEDKDLWKYNLPYSREINAALESFPFEFNVFDALEYLYPNYHYVQSSPLIDDGKAILRFQERQVETSVKRARPITILGHNVLIANSCLASQVASRLAKGRPFGISWYVRDDGKYVYSLRSEPDGVDVSLIAAEFGGGGHVHSAGFVSHSAISS